jgi:molybdopterin-guanine dinucleotide biosynthesis protein A
MEFLAHDRRPRLFLEQCQPAILDEALVYRLDPEGHTFFNLNTPQDLAQARQALANSSE